jgi:hypothetical protein
MDDLKGCLYHFIALVIVILACLVSFVGLIKLALLP